MNTKKRNLIASIAAIKFIIKNSCFERGFRCLFSPAALLACGLALAWNSAGLAQARPAPIRLMRIIESDKTGLQYPTGLAFSSKTNAIHILNGPGPGAAAPAVTDITWLSAFARRAGIARVAEQVRDPINAAFDNKLGRLLMLQFPENQLLELSAGSSGSLTPTTLTRYAAGRFGLQNPQGMAVDPLSGAVFILDAGGSRILRIEPGLDGSFDSAVISVINLEKSGLVSLRGLALEPTTGHFYLVSPTRQKLYELSQTGTLLATLDLAPFRLVSPQGLVFAPSGDQTDDPSQTSLYLADSGSGQILEFSLSKPVSMLAAASSVQSALISTRNLASISPASPDPSGLTYLPFSNTLLMSDGEVDEKVNGITHFAGANLWELTLSGSVVRTANISPVAPTLVAMTDEPNGVAWNPANGHFFFTDDNAYKVFDLNPGADGLIGSADDTWTSFGTLAFGIGDPEGITFDTWHNQLFVVDGTNQEIYQFTPAGSLIAHFDVAVYGVTDPESVEFNPDSGTLYVLSSASNPIIIETTTSGSLLQTINVSANNAKAPAGLAYAPASDGSGVKHFYIVDRGIDNNVDPNIIDGKMYEMSAPVSSPPPVTNTLPATPYTPTATMTITPTATRTFTRTPTSTRTGTATRTATRTPSSTRTATATKTGTPTRTATRTMTAVFTSTPTITAARTLTPTMTNINTLTVTGTVTPRASNTATITPTVTGTFTPGASGTPTPTPTLTLTNTITLTTTITLTPTNTHTVTVTPTSAGFPVTGVLDNFNRANGAIGSNWTGDKSSFTITSNQLLASSDGMLFWKTNSFGADQEAYISLINIDPASTNMDLLLKSQTTTKESFLEVEYIPASQVIQVETYTRAQGYVNYGASLPVTFVNGDQFGVRATAGGQVYLYKNGSLLGTRDVSAWSGYASGGYIGLLSWGGAPNNIYDNFGGGTTGP